MVLEVIYIVRHGFRSNWIVNPATGIYTGSVQSPTGIAADPALASYGEKQSEELASHVLTLDPPVDVVYSSPFYRCLQTVKPVVEKLRSQGDGKTGVDIRAENGLGEFYGLARFDHPSPAPLSTLHEHFPSLLHPAYEPVLIPSVNGESIPTLHNRLAYTIARIIADVDAHPNGPRALLICTHAASMIALGRVLTGHMPGDADEEDFRCFTCSLSRFERRDKSQSTRGMRGWRREAPEDIPKVDWRRGKGVAGGWHCVLNGDCSFLSGGEERGWRFSGDEAFLTDPNAFNDAANEPLISKDSRILEGRGYRL